MTSVPNPQNIPRWALTSRNTCRINYSLESGELNFPNAEMTKVQEKVIVLELILV